MPKRLGQIDTKDINYYSGQDRDPNTGLPKGLKSHSSVKKDTGVMDESLLGKIRQTLTGASSEINESVSEDIVQHDKLVKAIRNSETDKLTKSKLLSTAVKVRGLKSEEKEKGLDGKKCWKGYRLAGTKKKGGKTVDNCVKEEEKKNLDEGKVKYYSGQDRNPNTGLPKGLKAAPIRTEKEVNKKLDRTTLAQSYEPESEVISEGPSDVSDARTKAQYKGPGAPGLDAHRERIDRHKKKRGKKKVKEGYQRNPERDTRSARQRRMDDPDRGINSQAFRDFMAAQQSKPKKKKKKEVDESVYDTVKKVLDTGSNFMKKNPVGKALSNVVKPFKSTDGGSNRTSATAASQKAKGLRVAEEVVTELNRYEKETGKSSGSMNMPKGRSTQKGGTKDPVMRAVRTSIRKETGKPHGQKKKTKGEKGNRQYGDRKTTPADTIAKRRQSKADAEKLMRDTSGT